MSEHHQTCRQIVSEFEALALQLQKAIYDFAKGGNCTAEVAALTRAKDAVELGAQLARDAISRAPK